MARAIALTLTPDAQARLASARSVHPESYQDYLRGRYFWNRRTEAALKQALGYFQRAIAKGPDNARAYSGLADCYSALGASSVVGALPPRQAMPEAEAAARKALEIDGTLAEAHNSLAMFIFLRLGLAARRVQARPRSGSRRGLPSLVLALPPPLGRTRECGEASARSSWNR